MTEFRVHDVVSYSIGGSRRFAVVGAVERGRLLFGEDWWSTDSLCQLVYRPDTGVMDAFAADKNTGLMLELAQEQGKYVCVAGSSVFIDGDEDRCYDRLSSGTLHPESAMRLLERRRDQRPSKTAVTVTTAKQYQELFGKPAPVGMFEPATMAFDGGVLTVVHQGTSVNVLTGRDLDIECQKRFDLYREIGESDDAFRERCLSSPRSPGSFKAHLEKLHSEYTALASPKTPASNNCASCGDVLHETYDPSRIVDGQRHHGTCADRVERLKAEQAPKVVDDPYTQHRLSRNEELNRAAMDLLDDGFVSSFRADKEPESKAGSFVHPWTCDESEP